MKLLGSPYSDLKSGLLELVKTKDFQSWENDPFQTLKVRNEVVPYYSTAMAGSGRAAMASSIRGLILCSTVSTATRIALRTATPEEEP